MQEYLLNTLQSTAGVVAAMKPLTNTQPTGNIMKRSTHQMLSLLLAISASLGLSPLAWAQDPSIENAALRCSAISLVHSPLTAPTPQFGELMTQFAGLFAQVYITQKNERTKTKLNPNDVIAQRDAIITELGKGWPGVKNDRVREAAVCNAWRSAFFNKLPEKPSEKDFQQALMTIGPPPANVSKEEFATWEKVTPQAFAMWAQIKVNQKDTKNKK
ncbi:MAG: hypothetical protein ACKOAO_03715 [Oxalobacteraceae bacterium]